MEQPLDLEVALVLVMDQSFEDFRELRQLRNRPRVRGLDHRYGFGKGIDGHFLPVGRVGVSSYGDVKEVGDVRKGVG